MNTPPAPLALSNEEKRSPLWRKLMAHWEVQATSLSAQLERHSSEVDTANLRGRLAVLRATMALNKDAFKE